MDEKKHSSELENYYYFFPGMRQLHVNINSTAVQYHFYAPLISMFCPHLWQGHIFISFHIMPADNGPQPLLSLLSFPMQFRCCGVTNHTDWFEVYNATRVPDSCCLEYSDNCGQDNPGTWWTAVSLGNIFISLVGVFLLRNFRHAALRRWHSRPVNSQLSYGADSNLESAPYIGSS